MEAIEFFDFFGGKVNSYVGLGEFINEAVNLDEDTGAGRCWWRMQGTEAAAVMRCRH